MSAVRGRVPAARSKYSLRLRLFVVIAIAALSPLLVVAAWSQIERPVPGRMWQETLDATNDAAAKVGGGGAASREALEAVARARRARVRVIDDEGRVVVDADHDVPADALDAVDAFFFGGAGAEQARAADDDLGPLAERSEIAAAREGELVIGCDVTSLVVCQGARHVEGEGGRVLVVHAQKSSARAVRAVYALRARLGRLALVTLPIAIALALYVARRFMRPIDRLRNDALERAMKARPEADLAAHDDEVGDLASAFNALLAALDARRAENEAFVADLAHEMKSPIAAIRAGADALASGAAAGEREARLARVLDDSASKLDDVVTHFLELARAEAGLPEEERVDVDLGALAAARAEHVRDDERHRTVEVVVERAEGASCVVRGVAHRLDAALRELLENAASFAGPGGRVVVRVEAREEGVAITIRDSGPGIAPEDLPKVFTRFFTKRRAGRGTGLGLALVRAVVEAHGGRITARSVKGEGATFEIVLPRTAPG